LFRYEVVDPRGKSTSYLDVRPADVLLAEDVNRRSR